MCVGVCVCVSYGALSPAAAAATDGHCSLGWLATSSALHLHYSCAAHPLLPHPCLPPPATAPLFCLL